jgi:predicted nucleotide-binding protein
MARRPSEPVEPRLTAEQLRNRIQRLERCIADLDAFDPQTVEKRFGEPRVVTLEAAIDDALSASFGHGTPTYDRYRRSADLDQGPVQARLGTVFGRGPAIDYDAKDRAEARRYLAEGKLRSIAMLRQAIRSLQDQLEEHEQSASAPFTTRPSDASVRKKIFVVHGHDEAALQAVARFLERIELEPIVLKEQPDRGLTIIEKFVEYAGHAGFAVILLTPDDLGGAAASETQQERARQNVIFELGFFVGQLGRGHVCLMRKGKVEMPSDLSGVIYKDLDSGESWKFSLVQELKAAGVTLDANKIWDR